MSEAARELRISRRTLHVIPAGTASVTPEMALRLARLSDPQAELWLSLQPSYDLWRAAGEVADLLWGLAIHPLPDALRTEIGCHGQP